MIQERLRPRDTPSLTSSEPRQTCGHAQVRHDVSKGPSLCCSDSRPGADVSRLVAQRCAESKPSRWHFQVERAEELSDGLLSKARLQCPVPPQQMIHRCKSYLQQRRFPSEPCSLLALQKAKTEEQAQDFQLRLPLLQVSRLRASSQYSSTKLCSDLTQSLFQSVSCVNAFRDYVASSFHTLLSRSWALYSLVFVCSCSCTQGGREASERCRYDNTLG